MVRIIVHQHDGVLQLHSEMGKGTQFRILLPIPSLERVVTRYGRVVATEATIDQSYA